jgi:hypothetical protein
MKLRIDELLRFWIDVAYDHIKFDHPDLTKRQLLAEILRRYERRGDAMRYLNSNGKVAWRLSPAMLMVPGDAEADARAELADFP